MYSVRENRRAAACFFLLQLKWVCITDECKTYCAVFRYLKCCQNLEVYWHVGAGMLRGQGCPEQLLHLTKALTWYLLMLRGQDVEGLSSCYWLNKVSVKNYSFQKEQLLTVVSLPKKLFDNFTKTLFFLLFQQSLLFCQNFSNTRGALLSFGTS